MNPAEPNPSVPVAIIGMGCLFPKADSLGRYWINIRDGVDAIREIPASHWNPDDLFDADPKAPDKTYARRGGFLDPVAFPALDFGIAPNNLDATDTTQLLGLLVARAALEDAGYGPGTPERPAKPLDRERVSVMLGVTGALELVIPLGARLGHPIWRRALKEAGVAEPIASDVVQRISDSYVGWQENSFPGLLGNVAAGRIANRLDLGGTNCVVDAACASSLGAVHLALLELAAGRSDVCLTGGLDTFNDIFMYMCFSKTPALSPTGDAKPFSLAGDGTALGEGLGVLTLKRLDDAQRDGDRIYAVIKGVGSSSDGKGNAVYAPAASGQARCLNRAYEAAGISPATVELVEAHGTGTKVGDAVELSALANVYRAARPDGTWCALGSVKSQIGHTKAAAGAAGLIKAALALHHKVLPPTIKVDQPAEVVAPGVSPFYVNTEARPWLAHPDHPRRAAVSAFGFGGSNFHCVLEEADATTTASPWDGDDQIVAFSGPSVAAIRAELDAWPSDLAWDAVRVRAAESRARFAAGQPHRLTIVLDRAEGAWAKRVATARSLLDGGKAATTPEGITYAIGTDPGKLAILFPGQGSQSVGMLWGLACRFPEFLAALNEAAGPSRPAIEATYPHPVFNPEARANAERTLRATNHAQPAIGAVSLGALRVLRRFGIEADAYAGHSFGELTALHAGGRIDAAAFARLAQLRGDLMAGESGPATDRGGMLAVMGSLDQIETMIRAEGLDLVIANRNTPTQTVLSGSTAEIARAERAFAAREVRTKVLDVAAAFHSPIVAGASGPLAEALRSVEIAPASVPVYGNTHADVYPDDAAAVRSTFAAQLAAPVRFVEEVEAMARSGVRTFLEVGPGATLTGMVGSILGDQPGVVALALDASKGKGGNVADLARTLARLAALGHSVDLTAWDGGLDQVPPVKKTGLTVPVSGANFTPKPVQRPPLETPAAVAPTSARAVNPVRTSPPPSSQPDPAMPPPPSSRPPTSTPKPNRSAAAPARNGSIPIPALHPHSIAQPVPPPPAATASTNAASILAEAFRSSQENLVALQRMGEQTANLHRQFLEGQDRATQTFGALLDHQHQLIFGAIGSTPAPVPAAIAAAIAAPTPPPVAGPARGPIAPPVRPVPTPVPRVANPPVAVASPAPRPAPPRPVLAPAPARATSNAAAVHAALAEVVSEKTGYPADVLEPTMQLDADLGIDSIKRVEILAAIQERLPEAPVIGPEHLGTIRTLGQIVEFLAGQIETAPTTASAPAPAAQGTSNAAAVHAALAEVVSEKTGYPADVLEPTMQLDADLGIDSIKRVEILAAIQERLPEAPVIGPEHLGTIRTLGQIVDFLAGGVTKTVEPTAVISAPSGINPAAVHAALAEVVSEKTGYPADVLEPTMQLDADLGIDSIKRVEILAAIQERLPEAPVIGPEHLGTIRTLGQIVDFLAGGKATAAPEPAPPVSPASAAVSPLAAEDEVPVRRYVPVAVPLRDEGRPAGTLPVDGDVWVADDGSALAAAVMARLGQLGHRVVGITKPGDTPLTAPNGLAGLVLFAAPRPDGGANLDAFRLLRAAGPELRKLGRFGAACVAVTRLGGTFGLGDPATIAADEADSGGLAGLVKTAGHEWPEVACKAIDVDPTWDVTAAAAAIVIEMTIRGPVEVGLSAHGKIKLSLQARPVDLSESVAPLGPKDVVVVSGGARGVTAEVAVALAEAFRPTIVLLGRSPTPEPEPEWLRPLADEAAIKRALHGRSTGKASPPALNDEYRRIAANREVLANLRRIEAAGACVLYRSVDVRDEAAVATILGSIRSEIGPIRGLVHGAGVLADRKIEDQTDDQFASVFGTKVGGLDALLRAVEEDDLRALVLFSSSTARFGRTGQVAYAAANEVLNKRAAVAAVARPGCRVVAVNWGPWAGGMVTPALQALFASEGIATIPLQVGAAYLIDELRATTARPTEVVILGGGGPEPNFLRDEDEAATAPSPTAPASEPTPDLAPSSSLTTVFERVLDLESTPILRAHVMDGRPVLPMALILEWLGQAAMTRHPGMVFAGVDDLRVLKGVVLRGSNPETIRVLAGKAERGDDRTVVPVELRGTLADGRDVLHARGSVVLADGAIEAPETAVALDPTALPPLERSVRSIYRDVLFHGPALHGIQGVDGCGDAGISAEVAAAPAPSAWIAKPLRNQWLTDPLALDSAFQLMIVWSVDRLGAGSLPTFIGQYRQFRRAFPKDGTRVEIQVIESSPHKARASVDFRDAAGVLVARIDNYECVIDASLQSAFRRNGQGSPRQVGSK